MATKVKAKGKTKVKAAKAANAINVGGHTFPVGTEVGFWPAGEITVERNLGRKPIPDATTTAKVAKDGTLSVGGLDKGPWLAAAEIGETYRYFAFSVKD
jgi:hypothetical protein